MAPARKATKPSGRVATLKAIHNRVHERKTAEYRKKYGSAAEDPVVSWPKHRSTPAGSAKLSTLSVHSAGAVLRAMGVTPGRGDYAELIANIKQQWKDDPSKRHVVVATIDATAAVSGDSRAVSTELALNLLKAASDGSVSSAISPLSIGAGLALLHDGAKEDTQKELRELLGSGGLSPAAVSTHYSSLTAALSKQNASVVMSVACRFFLDKRFRVKGEYAAHIKKSYMAAAEILDFEDGEGSAKELNNFVKVKTDGVIPMLLTADAFTDAAAVLVNAVYFKGQWNKQFGKTYTETRKFRGVAGERDAEFMEDHNRNTLFLLSKNLAVVSLPYKDPSYSMVFLMPTSDFSVWREGLTAKSLQAAMDGIRMGEIKLLLPKFRIESPLDCKEVLQKLGVGSIFTENADLSGISDVKGLCVADITTKAVVDVSESGTCAGASTAVGYTVLGCIPPEMCFNKPFLYIIKRHDDVLYIGDYC